MTREEEARLVYGALCEAGRPDIEIGNSENDNLACRVRLMDGTTRPATREEFLLVQRAIAVLRLTTEPLPYTGVFYDGKTLAGPR